MTIRLNMVGIKRKRMPKAHQKFGYQDGTSESLVLRLEIGLKILS